MRFFNRTLPLGPWLLALALLTPGCAFPTKHIGTIAASTKRITYQGTVAALKADPNQRSKFILAASDLTAAIDNGTIDSTLLVQITQTIPSKRLTGDIGIISIEVGALVLDIAGGEKVDLNKAPNVRAIAIAMRDGIELALKQPVSTSKVLTIREMAGVQ